MAHYFHSEVDVWENVMVGGATLQFMIDLILYIGPISCGRVKLCVECFGIKLKISCYRGHSGLEDHQIQNKNVVPETAEKLLAFLIN